MTMNSLFCVLFVRALFFAILDNLLDWCDAMAVLEMMHLDAHILYGASSSSMQTGTLTNLTRSLSTGPDVDDTSIGSNEWNGLPIQYDTIKACICWWFSDLIYDVGFAC